MLSQATQISGNSLSRMHDQIHGRRTVSTLVAIDLDGLKVCATSCQGLSYVRGSSCRKIYLEERP